MQEKLKNNWRNLAIVQGEQAERRKWLQKCGGDWATCATKVPKRHAPHMKRQIQKACKEKTGVQGQSLQGSRDSHLMSRPLQYFITFPFCP